MVAPTDPFAVLGVAATASVGEVRAARRRLAKALHPDALVGAGDSERQEAESRLAEANRALDLALAAVSARDASEPDRDQRRAHQPVARQPAPAPSPEDAGRGGDDDCSVTFSIEALPAVAFELLVMALSSIGDPKVVDEPYLLEGLVDDPALGFCRIHLVPEAGGSIVTVDVLPVRRARTPPPPATAVAGRLIAEMEMLGPV